MEEKDKPILVSDIKRDKLDPMGDKVQEIYTKSSTFYVVYRAANRVRVIFADDPETARLQRDIFAPLEMLRGEILALTEGWMTAGLTSGKALRLQSYNRRLADGLALAFRTLPEAAKAALESVRDDVMQERSVIGRQQYFAMSVGMAAVWVSLFAIAARSQMDSEFLWLLVKLVGAGCFGAMFSIMLSLSSRKIKPDFLGPQNLMDALLRISIASMSAIVIFVLLRANIVDLSVNGIALGAGFQDKVPNFGTLGFLACFFAGFSEKLVGDFVSVAELGLKTVGTPQAKAGADEADAAATRASNASRNEPLRGPAGSTVTDTAPKPVPRGPAGGPVPEAEDDEIHVDGCACDMHDHDDTADEELPPARGGVKTGEAQ